MNELAQQFLKSCSRLRILSEEKNLAWKEIHSLAPTLPKGWFELSQLSGQDRIGFVRDHWQQRLPYFPECHTKIAHFFSHLDDIGVILSGTNTEGSLEPELIYSLYENRCFFRGLPGVTEEGISELEQELSIKPPSDYLSFLRIHNGFGRLSTLGLFPCEYIAEMKQRVKEMVLEANRSLKSVQKEIDMDALIPFYEEEGLCSFQCFFADWYPVHEMGNVYLSGIDYTISDTSDRRAWREALAFPTFLEWFCEYLEGMNLSP